MHRSCSGTLLGDVEEMRKLFVRFRDTVWTLFSLVESYVK
jgi:hypothetical protein